VSQQGKEKRVYRWYARRLGNPAAVARPSRISARGMTSQELERHAVPDRTQRPRTMQAASRSVCEYSAQEDGVRGGRGNVGWDAGGKPSRFPARAPVLESQKARFPIPTPGDRSREKWKSKSRIPLSTGTHPSRKRPRNKTKKGVLAPVATLPPPGSSCVRNKFSLQAHSWMRIC